VGFSPQRAPLGYDALVGQLKLGRDSPTGLVDSGAEKRTARWSVIHGQLQSVADGDPMSFLLVEE
jgi:hypothetical protein